MENNLKNYQKQLQKYCKNLRIETHIKYTDSQKALFTIKLTNELAKNIAISLAKNIIIIKETSFQSISCIQHDNFKYFSFISCQNMQLDFLQNLVNFIKIITLNNIYNNNVYSLEEIIPIKLIKCSGNTRIIYNIINNTFKIDNNIYNLNKRIRRNKLY